MLPAAQLGGLLCPTLRQVTSDWSGPKLDQLLCIFTFNRAVSPTQVWDPQSLLISSFEIFLFFQINWFIWGPWPTRGGWCDNSQRHSRHQWCWRRQTAGCRWGTEHALPHDSVQKITKVPPPALSAAEGTSAYSSSFSLPLTSFFIQTYSSGVIK